MHNGYAIVRHNNAIQLTVFSSRWKDLSRIPAPVANLIGLFMKQAYLAPLFVQIIPELLLAAFVEKLF